MDQARTLLTNMTMRGRLALAGSVLGVLVVGLMMFRLASQPSYSLITTGLDPAEVSKVTGSLDEKGIGYELRNNGTALAVDKSQLSQARVALAQSGMPGQAGPGFELFDKQKLGASDFQQKVTYQRALEGEIARTVSQVQGVTGVQVQLALPTRDLFADTQKPATAAVLLTGSSDALDPASVRGIARLVSSSVEGLKQSDVTIADGGGRLLWPASGADGATTGATSKHAVEARYAQELQGRLNALLVQTLGPGKAQVQATAELNTDAVTKDELAYSKTGVPLTERTETERLRGSGSAGTAGSTGNVPSFAQNRNGASNDYRRTSENTTYGVDKTVTRTKVATGDVEKLSVALLVDKSVPPAQLKSLEEAIKGAAGITPARGDKLTVAAVAFVKPQKPKSTSPVPPAVIGPAKYVGLGVAVLAFMFFMRRHLRRREGAPIADARWLQEISAPRTLPQLESSLAEAKTTVATPRSIESPRREVEEIVNRDPAGVAAQVRSWMHDG